MEFESLKIKQEGTGSLWLLAPILFRLIELCSPKESDNRAMPACLSPNTKEQYACLIQTDGRAPDEYHPLLHRTWTLHPLHLMPLPGWQTWRHEKTLRSTFININATLTFLRAETQLFG